MVKSKEKFVHEGAQAIRKGSQLIASDRDERLARKHGEQGSSTDGRNTVDRIGQRAVAQEQDAQERRVIGSLGDTRPRPWNPTALGGVLQQPQQTSSIL